MRAYIPAFVLAAALAVPAALPAAAETADIGFGRYDIACDGQITDVNNEMHYRGVKVLAFDESYHQYVLSVEFDPALITLVKVVESLRRIGFHTFVLGTPSAFVPKSFVSMSTAPGS